MSINVKSEIGKLKKVLLHRPGTEVEDITPSTFEKLLFDDSMYLEVAQKEHDFFAQTLKDNGVEVVYSEELVAEAISTSIAAKDEFISKFICEANISNEKVRDSLKKYLNSFKSNLDLVKKCIAGIYFDDINYKKDNSLFSQLGEHIWVTEPLPNILFTRDNFASVGNGITLHRMFSPTRNRECMFYEMVFKFHPEYKSTPQYYKRSYAPHIEGGDVLVIKNDTLFIGVSQRTSAEAIDILANNLFNEYKDSGFKNIYAFVIPSGRAWMHLDTVFTQVSKELFTVYDDSNMTAYHLTPGKNGEINTEKLTGTLKSILTKILGWNVNLLRVAEGHPVHAEREQWNDGANSLAIAPNHVVAYSRNTKTLAQFKKLGVKVSVIYSSELSRGRGGPRCMSMPLQREDVDWSTSK